MNTFFFSEVSYIFGYVPISFEAPWGERIGTEFEFIHSILIKINNVAVFEDR